MRSFAFALVVFLSLGGVATGAMAQESLYIRQNRAKFIQWRSQAASRDNDIRILQPSMGAQHSAFNRGMASKNTGVRSRAKRKYLDYLNRLIGAYLNAENAYKMAVTFGQRYVQGCLQLSSKVAEGRRAAAQVQGVRNEYIARQNTRIALRKEATDASNRH